MASTSNRIGQSAESVAVRYLTAQGLTAIAQNYRSRYGEIDIIMKDGPSVVFIEVRFRKHAYYGDSLESITPAKQKRIIKTANFYLYRNHWVDKCPCRFDIIALSGTMDNDRPPVWIKDAFRLN